MSYDVLFSRLHIFNSDFEIHSYSIFSSDDLPDAVLRFKGYLFDGMPGSVYQIVPMFILQEDYSMKHINQFQ